MAASTSTGSIGVSAQPTVPTLSASPAAAVFVQPGASLNSQPPFARGGQSQHVPHTQQIQAPKPFPRPKPLQQGMRKRTDNTSTSNKRKNQHIQQDEYNEEEQGGENEDTIDKDSPDAPPESRRLIYSCTLKKHPRKPAKRRAKGEPAPQQAGQGAGGDKQGENNNKKNKKQKSFHPKPSDAPIQRMKMIYVDGQLQVDPNSILVGGRPKYNVTDTYQEEVEETTEFTATSSSFTQREKSEKWSVDDTAKFYRGLQQYGTDFSMMCDEFPNRTRNQLKNKFKKEERQQPKLVMMALQADVPMSMNVKSEDQEDGESDEDLFNVPAANVGAKPQSVESETGPHIVPDDVNGDIFTQNGRDMGRGGATAVCV